MYPQMIWTVFVGVLSSHILESSFCHRKESELVGVTVNLDPWDMNNKHWAKVFVSNLLSLHAGGAAVTNVDELISWLCREHNMHTTIDAILFSSRGVYDAYERDCGIAGARNHDGVDRATFQAFVKMTSNSYLNQECFDLSIDRLRFALASVRNMYNIDEDRTGLFRKYYSSQHLGSTMLSQAKELELEWYGVPAHQRQSHYSDTLELGELLVRTSNLTRVAERCESWRKNERDRWAERHRKEAETQAAEQAAKDLAKAQAARKAAIKVKWAVAQCVLMFATVNLLFRSGYWRRQWIQWDIAHVSALFEAWFQP